jgi:hypothetical protein
MEGFIACFEGLEDPRTGNAGRHNLLEILMIALCTVLCGGQSAMAEFAEDNPAQFFDPGAWPAEPRHVQPGPSSARSRPIPRLLSALHGAVRRSRPGRRRDRR